MAPSAPRLNLNTARIGKPYQQVFNEEQRRIVENAFAREIELHGYRFEP